MRVQVYSLDARNHGDSPHSSDTSYFALAEDIKTFIESEMNGPAIVMGHSMGGRAAMTLALTNVSEPYIFQLNQDGTSKRDWGLLRKAY